MLGDRTPYEFSTVPPETVYTNAIYKAQLASEFGGAAARYERYAIVQRQCAAELVSLLQETTLPEGTILELGCGTGFVTRELIEAFPDRPLEITDLSTEMVSYCRETAPEHPSISFQQRDAEQLTTETLYGAIASGFVVQWFDDVAQSLERLGRSLVPGGVLVASFPTSHSFPEWKQTCEQVDLPFTGNPMPDVDFLCQRLSRYGLECRYHAQWMTTTYDRAIDFFKGLKLIGAGLKRSPPLTSQQLRQLVQVWDTASSGKIQVSYHIAFLVIQRQ
jgi:malonyl-CoA O-methyltransferase